MNIKIFSGVLTFSLLLQAGAHMGRGEKRGNRFVYGQMVYDQDLKCVDKVSYPDWNPGEGACLLHPTNVLELASESLSSLVTNAVINPESAQLSLFESNECWFYDVGFELAATNGAPRAWSKSVNLIVGIDGKVPEVTQRPYERRKFGQGFRRAPPVELTPEEQADKCEEVQENLRQYQMEVIRAGMPPLPIPLTRGMDERLVTEGILPPKEKPPTITAMNNSWINALPVEKPKSGIPND